MNEFQERQWIEAAPPGRPGRLRVPGPPVRKAGDGAGSADMPQPGGRRRGRTGGFSPPGGAPNFRGEASFSTWLYRLTSNACVDLLRREGRHRSAAGPSLNDEESDLHLPDDAPGPQEQAERRELREQIETALQALTPEHRQVLVLREMHQLSYDEIAQVLKLDVGTVKSRINRGRKQLRNFLLKSGNFSPPAASKESGKEG